MTPSGSIELDVLLLQFALSFLGSVAGVRIIDDIRAWREARTVRVTPESPE